MRGAKPQASAKKPPLVDGTGIGLGENFLKTCEPVALLGVVLALVKLVGLAVAFVRVMNELTMFASAVLAVLTAVLL